jgi:hypothetical protein
MPLANIPGFWDQDRENEAGRVQDMKHLFEGFHEIVLYNKDGGWKLPLYYNCNWLGDRLTKTLGALIWRQYPRLQATDKQRANDLTALIQDTGLWGTLIPAQHEISYSGYTTLRLVWAKYARTPRLMRWNQHIGDFVWWEKDGQEPFKVTFYREEVIPSRVLTDNSTITVRVGETFELDTSANTPRVIVTNKAYVVSKRILTENGKPAPYDFSYVEKDKPFPLSELPGNDPIPAETVWKMDCLPAYPICNAATEGNLRAGSDYTPALISLQKSQARLASQRDLAILINEMPALNVPVEYLNQDGTLDLSKVFVYVRELGEGDDDTPRVPINFNSWTGNLHESERQWEFNNETFYQLTGLCPALDGKAIGSAGESGYARRLGLIKTECAVEERRTPWDAMFDWFGRAAPQYCVAVKEPDLYHGPIEGIEKTWPDAIPDDQDANTVNIQAGFSKWISRRQAIIMQHPEWQLTPELIDEEEACLQTEADQARALAMPTFSQPYGPQSGPHQGKDSTA